MADYPRKPGPDHSHGEHSEGAYAQGGYGSAAAGPRYAYAAQGDESQRWRAPGIIRRISWGAVIAGTVVALVVHLMLSVLGIGIGATQIEPAAGAQAVGEGLAIGAAVWWVLSMIIALFIGGWFAGYLAGIPERMDGALHGIVTWGLAMLLMAWMLTTTMGVAVTGAWNVVEGGLAAAGEQAGQVDPQQAEQAVEDVEQQLEDPQVQQEAAQMADTATEAVAHAGIWTFVGMILAAAAAAGGGLLGAPQDAPRTHLGGGRREEEDRGDEGRRDREPDEERYHERRDYDRGERERAEQRDREERERTERERAERERAERGENRPNA